MPYKAEKIVPYDNTRNKGVQVEQMFDSIAENYDKLNHTLSLGIDRGWRKKGILSLKKLNPKTILDIATGTGDLAVQACGLLNPDKILAIDLSEKMMDVGRQKVSDLHLNKIISFEKQDCMNLDIEDNSFDAAMVAFGIRNFENLDKGLKEILRVLKPGGRLMILELSTPRSFPMKQGYWLYSKIFIPTVGRLISKDKSAYVYLPKSIEAFSQGKEMVDILTKNGYKNAACKTFTFGICSMYIGDK
ncbi:MAG: bifunctional demethylmenaquinone methyltransferase/2-methoxy-6-polyprenyl-1,4-benzoquinol methylase UbiE [Dysgonomonas sp.]